MCSAEKLKMAAEDRAVIFNKRKFNITTGITLVILLITGVVAFTTMRLQAVTNCNRLDAVEETQKGIPEIQYNLKALCEASDVPYIEIKK